MWIHNKLATVETIYWKHLRGQQIILYYGKQILLKPISQNVCFHYYHFTHSITMPVRQAVTWENIKLYFVSIYGFSIPVKERISKKGLKDALTV